jgi:uncharacterized protein YycO
MIWQTYPVVFGCYQGRSLIPSRLIRWFTWSDYSHVAVYIRDRPGKKIVEAWSSGGVQAVDGWLTNHKAGTPVDLFAFCLQPTESRLAQATGWIGNQIGKRYDWRGVFRFLTRAGGEIDGDWFCSELAGEFAAYCGEALAHKPAYKLTPGDVAASARLTPICRI